ncbi:hypothetical protein L1049_000752 [Liquidambar formosana]|uniref:Uncharacterized protein n=1 Tax=Liquidambar formosana TaxID=63359 RepID=A0AAP0NC11_LIQFO
MVEEKMVRIRKFGYSGGEVKWVSALLDNGVGLMKDCKRVKENPKKYYHVVIVARKCVEIEASPDLKRRYNRQAGFSAS